MAEITAEPAVSRVSRSGVEKKRRVPTLVRSTSRRTPENGKSGGAPGPTSGKAQLSAAAEAAPTCARHVSDSRV